MIQAFAGASVVGFLGTAGPRMLSAPRLKPWELVPLFILHLAGGLCHLRGMTVWGDSLFLALLLGFAAALGVRVVGFRKELPPPPLLLAATGLICGIAGTLLWLNPGWLLTPGVHRLAGLLLYQGFLLGPVMGVGIFLFPRLLGSDFGEPEPGAETRKSWRNMSIVALVLLASHYRQANHSTIMNLLIIQNVAKSHDGATVFAGVNFTLAPDDRLAVLGASGSGKTNLLRLLAGLDRPTSGVIERAADLRIGMVFQDLALWPNLSALGNVALALPDVARSQRHETARAALAACRVDEFTSRKPGTLSIGQQQRVALARAIAARPQLLLLDEPFSSLDPLLREELMSEVRRLADEMQVAVVLVTHAPLEALTLCRRALVLEEGRVVEAGGLEHLLAAQQSRLLLHFAMQMEQSRTVWSHQFHSRARSQPAP